MINKANSANFAQFEILDSASSITQSTIFGGSETGHSNEAETKGTHSKESGFYSGESVDDQVSVITISSTKTVLSGIFDGPEPYL